MIAATTENREPSLAKLARKTVTTGLGALENRTELLMVEVQEEKSRLINLIVIGIGALFLAMMTLLLLTGAIIFLVPEPYRLYTAIGFFVLYLAGTIGAIFGLKGLLKKIPFEESLNQIRKDRELLDVFK
jgi:uncharacterized membrane protein YqjE